MTANPQEQADALQKRYAESRRAWAEAIGRPIPDNRAPEPQ